MFGIGVAEIIIVLLIYLVPLILLVWFVRYMLEMARERRRLRLEVSKLAHELEGLRNDHGESL